MLKEGMRPRAKGPQDEDGLSDIQKKKLQSEIMFKRCAYEQMPMQ
jgi:hypothetical protein